MPDPCPTCGHTPEPSPADWLAPDEEALVAFLLARLAEHREDVEAYAHGPARLTAIAASDLAVSVRSVVAGWAWTRDPDRRSAMRLPILLLTQPWAEHPDHAWMPELRDRLGV